MKKEKNKDPLIKRIITGFGLLVTLFLISGVFSSKAFASSASSNVPQIIPVYTYHTHPPFIIETERGLSYDLAVYLSDKSKERFHFIVKPMSRPRVNKMIAESKTGIVPWVNPAWFKDKQEKKNLWAKGSLMEDGNSLISHHKRKVVYGGPQSLDGLVFGGVKDHTYVGIDDYIKAGNNLRRVDAGNHVDNFRKLAKQRIDVTITPLSGAEYLIKKEGLQDQLFISPMLHSQYKRRVMIINRQVGLGAFVDTLMEEMVTDPQWLKIMLSYQ
jgi:polar amino acid transport system substrate-binding protein